jgi:hypothetical protein
VTTPDTALRNWIEQCRVLAESELEAIEDTARDLAGLAAGDRQMMERARRMLLEALEHEPNNSTLHRMYALWRRAFEIGAWTWEESPIDHNPLLS